MKLVYVQWPNRLESPLPALLDTVSVQIVPCSVGVAVIPPTSARTWTVWRKDGHGFGGNKPTVSELRAENVRWTETMEMKP